MGSAVSSSSSGEAVTDEETADETNEKAVAKPNEASPPAAVEENEQESKRTKQRTKQQTTGMSMTVPLIAVVCCFVLGVVIWRVRAFQLKRSREHVDRKDTDAKAVHDLENPLPQTVIPKMMVHRPLKPALPLAPPEPEQDECAAKWKLAKKYAKEAVKAEQRGDLAAAVQQYKASAAKLDAAVNANPYDERSEEARTYATKYLSRASKLQQKMLEASESDDESDF